jgi:putative lumazine-binding protein
MNLRYFFLTAVLAFLLGSCSSPPPPAVPTSASTPEPLPTSTASFNAPEEDIGAIEQTALDYIEGWYEGDAERMERSLHPDLVKRTIQANRVNTLSAEQMVGFTKQGGGKVFTGEKKNTVTILDIDNDIATVKVISAEYIDYLQMGKVNGKWVIINILWRHK